MEEGHLLVGDGDLFDILPWGRKSWEQSGSIAQLAQLLDGYPFEYVSGNHDPYKYMVDLMQPYTNIHVHKRFEPKADGRDYYITHGHRWSVDWGFLGLRRIAPTIVEFMVDIAPGFWYRFCRKMGWLASHVNPGASADKERERITNLTRIIWAGASNHALKNDCCVILGHTHTSARRERGISKEIGFQAYMADGGDLNDGTFVELADDARVYFLDVEDGQVPYMEQAQNSAVYK
jgi:UDP-2,3-diacylglucosamine pyrophosphatase LpxH